MKTLLSSAALFMALLFAVPANAQSTDTTDVAQSLQGQMETDLCPIRVPAIGLVTPSAYRQGYYGVLSGGLTLQSRTRLSGDRFDPDGNMTFSAGLGDPERYLGITALVNIYGLAEDRGAGDNFGEGTISLFLNRKLTEGLWVGAGGFDLTGWKREDPNRLTSWYLTATKTLPVALSEGSRPLYLTVGLGNGRFRSTEKFVLETSGSLNLFGSLAVPVLPQANLLVEWTGYNMFSGLSFFPFKDLPAQLAVGMDDIFHEKRHFILAGSMSLHFFRRNRTCIQSFGWQAPPPPQPSRI